MTHEDAALSTELAGAARKDSSAMKSIAMMTMLFLPGTFFAAVFSMESTPPAAAEHFWIFWVCAVVSTVVVFVVWKYHHRLVEAKSKRKLSRTLRYQQPRPERPSRAPTEDTLSSSLVAELHDLKSV